MLKSRIFSTGIILLLAITISQAAYIDGIWQVNRSGELVEIRSTDYGIKAKFVNSSNWDHYERLRKNIFEDRRGNRYYIKTSDRLTWESRDGRRVINLEKSRNRNYARNNNNYRQRNRYDDDRHVCSGSCGTTCSMAVGYRDDGYSGTWTNRWRDLIAYVEFDGYNVRMKTNRSRKWTTYRRVGSRRLVFEDRFGNRVRFKNNGRLEWRRADNNRKIDFTRELF